MRRMALGDRIREARAAAGLSQRELARGIGVSGGVVTLWERGHRTPNVDTVCRIAELTFRDPAWLLIDEIHGSYQHRQLLTDEIELLDYYRRMSPKQRQNLLKFVHVSFDVRREIEHDREPAHP